jgi:hypothetical protein
MRCRYEGPALMSARTYFWDVEWFAAGASQVNRKKQESSIRKGVWAAKIQALVDNKE